MDQVFWLAMLLVFIGMGGLKELNTLHNYIRRRLDKEPLATIILFVGIGLLLV